MKNIFEKYKKHNRQHAKMDYKDADHKYKVAAGFIWLGFIGILITFILMAIL
jgi:hypothetical protein